MKFWKNLISGSGLSTIERRERRSGSTARNEPASVPTRRRSSSSRGSNASLSEDACGTTFVELIKRSGTHLGVIVTGGKDTGLRPRIADLVPGSWAQRSDVLCVGDLILGLNGLDCQTMTQHDIVQTLDTADKVQLEVKYRLPPSGPSNKTRTKVIQVTLKKENGTFGYVVRGGSHELPARCRPFSIVHVDRGGPAYIDGTLRAGDRIIAVNGKSLVNIKLPELQALLYQQDQDTVFTVEYDIAKQGHHEHGAILVEIFRDQGDLLGLGLSRCHDTQAIIIESMKQASLADRCGALHVGDILLAVGGQSLGRSTVDEVTDLIRDQIGHSVQLEVLPGALARNRSSIRQSLPSPCFSTMQRRFRGGPARSQERLPRQMSHSSLLELRGFAKQKERERKKYVSFTVELDRTGGPIGITLATEDSEDNAEKVAPILISSMTEGGLAQRTKAILLRDELVEVNGVNVKGKSLSEAIPLLQNAGSLVKLKLTRVVTIPERDFRNTSFRLPPCSPRPTPSPIYAPLQPAPSPIYAPLTSPIPPPVSPLVSNYPAYPGGFRSPSMSNSSHGKRSTSSSRTSDELPTITLLPHSGPKGSEGSTPQEVNKVTLFKDQIYEDFGFSVSDGLYERGIFVNRVRKGGPADVSGLLKAFDRILQINQTRTTEFDCCLAVPLIAAAGDKIELLVTRAFPDCEIELNDKESEDTSSSVPWIDETDKESSLS